MFCPVPSINRSQNSSSYKESDFSLGDFFSLYFFKEEGKKVQFNRIVTVILIPTKEEFDEAHLKNELWWSEEECEQFKEAAQKQIAVIAKINKIRNARQAFQIFLNWIDTTRT
jgi:hypothetical protein